MALKLGTGAEAYAPLAQAIIGGLLVSVVVTVFLVPAAYLLLHRREAAGRRGGSRVEKAKTLPGALVLAAPVRSAARARRAGGALRPACASRVREAEQLGLANNPQMSVARLNALASRQVVREVTRRSTRTFGPT